MPDVFFTDHMRLQTSHSETLHIASKTKFKKTHRAKPHHAGCVRKILLRFSKRCRMSPTAVEERAKQTLCGFHQSLYTRWTEVKQQSRGCWSAASTQELLV